MAALLSCAREAEFVDPVELGSPQSESLQTVPVEGGSLNCTVFANGEYTVTLNDPWIFFADDNSLRVKTFQGDGTVSLTMSENSGETRFGSITLSMGTRKFDILIRQRGALSSDAGIVATVLGTSSSTLTFTWYRDVDGEVDALADYAYPYRFSLYRNPDLTDQVASFTSEAKQIIIIFVTLH